MEPMIECFFGIFLFLIVAARTHDIRAFFKKRTQYTKIRSQTDYNINIIKFLLKQIEIKFFLLNFEVFIQLNFCVQV